MISFFKMLKIKLFVDQRYKHNMEGHETGGQIATFSSRFAEIFVAI